jgi:hypothetical protein
MGSIFSNKPISMQFLVSEEKTNTFFSKQLHLKLSRLWMSTHYSNILMSQLHVVYHGSLSPSYHGFSDS